MLCVLVNYKTSWLFVSVTLDQKFKGVVWEPPDVTYVTLRNRRSTGCKWVHSGRTRTKLTGKTPQVPGCPSISPNYRQRKKNNKVLKRNRHFHFYCFYSNLGKNNNSNKNATNSPLPLLPYYVCNPSFHWTEVPGNSEQF